MNINKKIYELKFKIEIKDDEDDTINILNYRAMKFEYDLTNKYMLRDKITIIGKEAGLKQQNKPINLFNKICNKIKTALTY